MYLAYQIVNFDMSIASAFERARIDWIGEPPYKPTRGMVLAHSSPGYVRRHGLMHCIHQARPLEIHVKICWRSLTCFNYPANERLCLGPEQNKDSGNCSLVTNERSDTNPHTAILYVVGLAPNRLRRCLDNSDLGCCFLQRALVT